MRHFGGSLIAIFVSLYILYPVMLVADAYVAPGFASNSLNVAGGAGKVVMCDRDGRNCAGSDIYTMGGATTPSIQCSQGDPCYGHLESQLEDVSRSEAGMNGTSPNDLSRAIRLNVLIFLTAVFLPAMNFIVIAAFGRELSHFLGEDADMSRLGQMI
jgi:hypothetical protein